jgi:predicted RNase H-like nuclease (RuvC/YqgF family)
MTEEMNEEYMQMLRKNIPQLDMALHINKSNLEHIEFLENKIIELEKNLIDEYQYINNLTQITGIECIEEYTTIMIKDLKQK